MNLFKLTVLLVYAVPLRCGFFGEAKSFPYDSEDDYAPRRGRAALRGDHLVSVDIRDRFSTRELDYRYDRATGRHTFSTKPPYLIDAVTRGGRTLWDAAEHGHEYGSEVVFGTDRRTNKSIFRVYFPGELSGRHDYLFHEVGQSHIYSYDLNPIWRAQDYRELCFKVLVCPPYVTLFLLDGTRLVFKKSEFGWELYDRVLDATNTLDLDYKLIDIDINDRKSAHTHEVRQDHVYSPDQEIYSFLPRFDYKIKSLRDGDTTFWRASGGHDAAFRVFVSRFHFPDIISVVVSTVDGAKRTFSKKLDSLLKSKWSELTPSSPNITAGKITR